MKNKYQILCVIAIVVIVYTVGFYIANHQEPLEIVYPPEDTILSIDDFTVNLPQGQVMVGSFAWDEVKHILPNGKTLGRSTIYSPVDFDCLFTFSKKGNILSKIHISEQQVSTSRNICIGDNFDKVVTAYGENYSYVSKVGDTTNFDVAYGADNDSSIFFHIRDNKVNKIIVKNEPSL